MNTDAQTQWESYRENEVGTLRPILARLGFTVDETQVHVGGERFLMVGAQDVGGGGFKLVLMGNRIEDGSRVIIKCSSEKNGIAEILHERTSRQTIEHLPFAYEILRAPKEILFTQEEDLVIFITEYITETRPLLQRSLEEQFFLLLGAFRMQEGIHATTYAHARQIARVFGMFTEERYRTSFTRYADEASSGDPENTELAKTLERASRSLTEHRVLIERYGDFLTHADFVPHNLRIKNDDLYLLDFASIHFGNKYESWARCVNFMTLYHPALGEALSSYVRDNRGEDEYLALKAMRIYKLVFLLRYYVTSLPKTSGDLETLTRTRIAFWTDILTHVIDGTRVPLERITAFCTERDKLRSEAEKERQRTLNQL